VIDDATKRLFYAQLWPAETIQAVMSALAHVVRTWGLPIALYTDRAGWAFHTPKAGGPVDRDHLTHVGRALARLGIAFGAWTEMLVKTFPGRPRAMVLSGISLFHSAPRGTWARRRPSAARGGVGTGV
jgi:hypothetical protein